MVTNRFVAEDHSFKGLKLKRADSRAMTLREIIDCCSELNITEKRCISEDFVELVFHTEEIEDWHRILTAFLGDPQKREGEQPTSQDLEITKNTGGIRLEQTLFEQEFENGIIIAKFWPWKDNIHITLRMALLKQ
jgi:hypothetical protein